MLELAILGLLKEQELHGYELKKRLVENLGLASGVSFGSLYPALARLEAAGAVKAVEAREQGSSLRPMYGEQGSSLRSLHRAEPTVPHTGSLGGEMAALRMLKPVAGRGSRGKKVYGITERGETLFDELLATESQSNDDDRLFNLRLAFARYLPPDARLGMLERRRAHLVERLIQMRARVKAARDGYAQSLVEHDREAAEHDLSWIERLIAREREGAREREVARDREGVAGPAGAGTDRLSVDERPGSAGASPADTREGAVGGPSYTETPKRRPTGVTGPEVPTLAGLRPLTKKTSPQEDHEQ